MKSLADGYGYNERIFESKGLRSYFHLARFRWLREKIAVYHGADRVGRAMELGCFDGKAVNFFPEGLPKEYLGFDANWENGLDLARLKFADATGFSFREVSQASQFNLSDQSPFQVAISMETLEHIDPAELDLYLQRIADKLAGHFFITVPNEKGTFFLLKWLAKRLMSKDGERYTAREVVAATLGRMHLVERDQHKGFDWERLVQQVNKHFDVVEVSGHPFSALPTSLCFSVGIVARTRR